MKISDLLKNRLWTAGEALNLILRSPSEIDVDEYHELIVIRDEFKKVEKRLLEKK